MVTVTTDIASPASARRVNARTILGRLWEVDQPSSTANELMASTGLTRATVLAVCDDLAAMGWVEELPAASIGPSSGRPPRRFRFRSDVGYVVGLDVGDNTIRGAVADLRGAVVGRAWRRAGFSEAQRDQRDATIRDVVDKSLAAAQLPSRRVLVASIGLAAPVTRTGATPGAAGSSYWERMSLGRPAGVVEHPEWIILVNNDANLAALAVGAHGEADPQGDYVALLAGERFGAGIVADGRLVLGRDGGAGDMHFLSFMEGLESREGLTAAARRMLNLGPTDSSAAVFQLARAGHSKALAAVDELADRLARVISVLASLLNPDRVVIGGAIAESADLLLDDCRRRIARYAQLPPTVTASALGADIVLLGAVQSAIAKVAHGALDIKLAKR